MTARTPGVSIVQSSGTAGTAQQIRIRGEGHAGASGRFVKLVPNQQVVQVVEFETADPALRLANALTGYWFLRGRRTVSRYE
jgi:hypothetical protein